MGQAIPAGAPGTLHQPPGHKCFRGRPLWPASYSRTYAALLAGGNEGKDPKRQSPGRQLVSRRLNAGRLPSPGTVCVHRPPEAWALLPSPGHRLLKGASQKGRP